jgi:predicted ATPase/class 3 adenylate cyclase
MTNPPSGTVTFLFTDIEGSTNLARTHSETWEDLRLRHHKIMREAIESNNGFVFQIIGDAFCAAFHKARDALQAAVKAQRDLQNESWGDCVIRVRMGIHTGEAELHKDEYQGYLTLSLVQRIMSAGHGGQILISNATENLLRGQLPKDVSLRDMGEHKFKDVPYPVRVFQVSAPDLQQEFPALRVLDVAPNNLPTQLTSFIGREKEAADVDQLLANTHLLTLIGPGGTGKTRLSLQVAADVLHSYPHGVWFIELAPVSDPSSVAAAVLSALNLPAEVHRPAIEMLCDYLRDKEALLILDNCEHLVEACAKLVDRLLHAAPKLRILASSREALGIAGEVSYRVPSMGLPDINQLPSLDSLSQYEAVRLFIDRARAAQPSFNVTNENAPAVAQICHRLDGIPLALELAAAKVRALSVDQIAKRLDDRFRLLTGGSRTALERHQTLRATLDWSYNLLPEHEQFLFRRLSIFITGWTLEATEYVCADETIKSEDIFDLLEQLVNKSLVIAEAWQSETRYRMLETMRQYANEKLIEAGESERLRDRHLNYYLHLAETAEPHLIRPEQLEWLDRLEADHDNLRTALEWSLSDERPERALRLTAALGRFWVLHCHWIEGIRWVERALAKSLEDETAVEKIARARSLVQEAALANYLDNLEKMTTSAQASLALCENNSGSRDLAIAKYWSGCALFRRAEFAAARSLLENSRSEFHALQDPYWEALTQSHINNTFIGTGEKSQRELSAEELKVARKVGERLYLADTLYWNAELAWHNHEWDAAEKYVAESQALFNQLGWTMTPILKLQGWIAHTRNDYQQAKLMYTRLKEQCELLGEKVSRSGAMGLLGMLAKDEGDLQQAQLYIEEALELDRQVGSKRYIGETLSFLGQIELLRGNFGNGKRRYRESISLIRTLNNPYSKSEVLFSLLSAFADIRPKFAVKLMGLLHAHYHDQLKEQIPPLIERELKSAAAQARPHLDESTFNLAWAEGAKMTRDDGLRLALKILDEI